MNEETKIRNVVLRQSIFEENGVNDPNVACAAAFIMDNIAMHYPVSDLVTSWPFSDAFSYVISAGLITNENPPRFTEKGVKVYNLEDRKIYPVQ